MSVTTRTCGYNARGCSTSLQRAREMATCSVSQNNQAETLTSEHDVTVFQCITEWRGLGAGVGWGGVYDVETAPVFEKFADLRHKMRSRNRMRGRRMQRESTAACRNDELLLQLQLSGWGTRTSLVALDRTRDIMMTCLSRPWKRSTVWTWLARGGREIGFKWNQGDVGGCVLCLIWALACSTPPLPSPASTTPSSTPPRPRSCTA
jgi:hypothetical protein